MRAKNRSFPKTKIKRLRIGQSGVNDDDVLLIHLDVVFRKGVESDAMTTSVKVYCWKDVTV